PDLKQIHLKLDELEQSLEGAGLDHEAIQDLQKRFNRMIRSASPANSIQPYARPFHRGTLSAELDEELEQLSFISSPDKKKRRKLKISKVISGVLRVIIALLLILLGFGMIIMPAPPYFEMFTLFYLSPNDGVTIMDVISLIVAFTGVYVLV